jgi:3-deoxy-D-manno-octulosonic-acid transferase
MFINLYQLFTIVVTPIIHILIYLRKLFGKEDKTRYRERFGYAAVRRSEGFVLWIHAASVGESISVLPLVEHLNSHFSKLNILLTTSTVTSTKIIVDKLPSSVMHQYIVVDNYFCVRRFVNHWKPDLALFIESELWPNLLNETAKSCPILLLNARMSDKSLKRWLYFKTLANFIMNKFELIVTQSKNDLEKFKILGATRLINAGNLKYANSNYATDEYEVEKLQQQLNCRKIWLAASTHLADEENIYQTHLELKKIYPDIITILAPRHPDRTSKIIDNILAHNLKFVCRTNLEPIKPDTDIYLANTLGEMNIFYSIAEVVFIGGSFLNGGHNPIEVANFSKPIIWGPNMSNFKEVAEEFLDKGAAIKIDNSKELTTQLERLLNHKSQGQIKIYVSNANRILQEHNEILDTYIEIISQYIPNN